MKKFITILAVILCTALGTLFVGGLLVSVIATAAKHLIPSALVGSVVLGIVWLVGRDSRDHDENELE